MAFFSIFVKLKDSATSKAFKVLTTVTSLERLFIWWHFVQEYDLNRDGFISYREFEKVLQRSLYLRIFVQCLLFTRAGNGGSTEIHKVSAMCRPFAKVITSSSLKTDVSTCYEHVNGSRELGQLWMHVIRTGAVALSWPHGSTFSV